MMAPILPSARSTSSDPPRGAAIVVKYLGFWNIASLSALGIALCGCLWGQWRHNPDLSHGLFMPLICVLLLVESRRNGTQRHLRPGPASIAATGLLAGIALVGLAAAGLLAVSLGWSPSIVGFTLAASFTSILLAGIVALSLEPRAVLPLNWSAFCAAALWLLAAPMPPGTYSTLTLRLQSWVTGNVIHALHFLGVAALQRGNLIELARTTVGIEEACSGIRSLISCVFAGLFLSAFLLRRPWARVLLLVAAAPLAIGMNFVRSLILTLLVNAGVNIAGVWHDATGFAILGCGTAILIGLALLLEPRRRAIAPTPPAAKTQAISVSALAVNQWVLAVALLLGCALAIFFIVQTHPSDRTPPPAPDLAALLPAAPAGWRGASSTDLSRFTDTLQTDDLVERTYYKEAGSQITQVTVYLAYWPPGRTSVSTVALHTPDACWPGVGWTPVASAATRCSPVVAGRALPPAESRLFTFGGQTQFVWFWHLYDGTAITQRDPRSVRELLAAACHYGFRKEGAQLFVRISSNHPWSDLANEPLLTEIFGRLQTFGL
jgi:exosortase